MQRATSFELRQFGGIKRPHSKDTDAVTRQAPKKKAVARKMNSLRQHQVEKSAEQSFRRNAANDRSEPKLPDAAICRNGRKTDQSRHSKRIWSVR
ncbi:hypothetical protein AVO44_08530 [Ruegeria profundi]|uniref:Uncharacterized protein n=1 Tax=Ruegeria profundi TaxID=1685378 RepID=A0A0X3TU69_9RHOB|nr:hypothetical protein AVO44_08530 [Ruegeria profundi]